MAAVLAFRIAIILAPIGVRIVQNEASGASESRNAAIRWAWKRLNDPDEDDGDLSADLSAHAGMLINVATYNEPFEVRRFQVEWKTSTTDLLNEDVRVCTFHLLKVAGGTPTPTWTAPDFGTAYGAFQAFWNAVRGGWNSTIALQGCKAYREGPALEPPQPPVYSNYPAPVTGAAPSTFSMPPQVAVSITEKTAVRASWGRMYLPAPADKYSDAGNKDTTDAVGRISSGWANFLATAADTMYEAWVTADLIPVVYRKPLPARFSAAASRRNEEDPDIDARPGSALSIDSIQIDNTYDVIRSRRWDKPSLRVQRVVGGT